MIKQRWRHCNILPRMDGEVEEIAKHEVGDEAARLKNRKAHGQDMIREALKKWDLND